MSLCVHTCQADSFKMGPEHGKNLDSLEQLLVLSGVGKYANAGGEAGLGQGLLIGGLSEGGGARDRVDHLSSSSSLNSSRTNLDSGPR